VRALAILASLSIATVPALARGAPGGAPGREPIVVLTPTCGAAPAFFRSFVESLRVELAAQAPECCEIWDAARPPPPASVRVVLLIDPCDASPERLLVTVDDPARGRSVNRRVLLADVAPVARPRALALAVAELIRLGPPPPDVAGPAPVTVTPVTPPATVTPIAAEAAAGPPAATLTRPPAAPAPTPAARRANIAARGDFIVRNYPARETTLYGAELSVRRTGRRLLGGVGLGGMGGDRGTAFGTVAFRAATAAGQIGVRLVTGAFDADLGVHGELGWAWIQGTPANAQVRAGSGSALLGNLGLRAAVQVPAERRLRAQLTVEAGQAVRGVDGRVNGQPVAGATGAYLLVGIGVGLGLVD
jgi:hypothetical protein